MENPNIVNYDPQQERKSYDSEMISLSGNKNSITTTTVHLKEETLDYHNMEYQNNRVRELPNSDVVNTSFIINEQFDTLGEQSMHHCKKGSSRKRKIETNLMGDTEDLLETRLRTMEKNLKYTIKKRIKKMEKKIMGLQKSMLNDIFFLYKEQPDVTETETNSVSQLDQSMCTLLEAPINSLEKFTDFEQKLKCDAKLQNNLISSFLAINCSSPGEFIRICWNKILTDEVAANFSWSIASTRTSICNRLITKSIKKAFALKFPINQAKFNTVTQKYFQYAKERSMKLDLNSDANIGKAIVDSSNLNNSKEAGPTTSSQSDGRSNEFRNSSPTGRIAKKNTMISSIFTLETPQEDSSLQFCKNQNKTGDLKNPPKSSAQRSREYRLRKKRSNFCFDRQTQSQSNDSSTSVTFIGDDMDTMNSEFLQETEEIDNYSKFNDIPEPATETINFMNRNEKSITTTTSGNIVPKIDISEYGFANQSNYGRSSRTTNDDTSQEYAAILYDDSFWKSPNKCNIGAEEQNVNRLQKSKPTPKTSAERSRAYRIRKRIKMAAALQREQLEYECFSNADPLSQNSTSIQ